MDFAEWDVVYCSVPTSPGGGYRSAFGRLFFKTKEMIQALEAPDIVKNKVSFSVFGFLDAEVSLKGLLPHLCMRLYCQRLMIVPSTLLSDPKTLLCMS